MNFKLKKIVPWGRSRQEYIKMFGLQKNELNLSILDCGGGPSSFNAEQYKLNNKVISCDPIYQFTPEQIRSRIQEIAPVIIQKLKTNYNKFVWQDITSPEQLLTLRMSSMNKFLDDLSLGLKQKRYLNQSLPTLPFKNQQFDLALCSHLLFTYSQQLDLEFHLQSIKEMCRVAKEVRIFPLLENFTGETSIFVQPVIKTLEKSGYQLSIEKVNYQFQINGDRMIRVYRSISS